MTPLNSLKGRNLGKNILQCKLYQCFLGQSPEAIQIKEKINKWDLNKLRSFFSAKEAMNKMKRQPIGWEKIFANEMTDKGLNRHFSKEDIQITNRNMKRFLTSLIIREKQIKTTMRYHFTWV